MTNEEKMAVLVLVFNTIFQSKAQNTDITQILMTTNMGNFPGRWFKDGLLRGFDLALNTGDKIVSIRCVEQNPNKMDKFNNLKKYANLARQGHQIMWVIDQNTENGFLGRMQDGEWVPSFVPATQPVTAQQPASAQPQMINAAEAQDPYPNYVQDVAMPIETDDLPEIESGGDIPEYVLESMAEMDEPPDWGDYE